MMLPDDSIHLARDGETRNKFIYKTIVKLILKRNKTRGILLPTHGINDFTQQQIWTGND